MTDVEKRIRSLLPERDDEPIVGTCDLAYRNGFNDCLDECVKALANPEVATVESKGSRDWLVIELPPIDQRVGMDELLAAMRSPYNFDDITRLKNLADRIEKHGIAAKGNE